MINDNMDTSVYSALSSNEVGYLPRVGNWEYDVTHNTDTWSETIFDILELPYHTKPSNIFTFMFYQEPYQGMLKKAIARAYQFGTPWDLELELVTAKGRTIWVRSYGSAVFENDTVLKVKGILMDIDKYRSNETSLNLLRQQHKQLSGFTHVLTHNLRNHANNISLLANLVERESLNEDNADLFEKIDHISKSLNMTLDHLSEVMMVSENMIESEYLNIESCMKSVLTLLAAELEQNEVDLQTDFIIDTIFFPRLYLDSILLNLISNSIKYRKDTEKPEILISTYFDEDKNCVIMEYQDNGIGIDLEKHGEKVFGLYRTFTDKAGAHGVGLFLVKTQIESQGGYIVVESKPDVGTVFRMFFKPGSHR